MSWTKECICCTMEAVKIQRRVSVPFLLFLPSSLYFAHNAVDIFLYSHKTSLRRQSLQHECSGVLSAGDTARDHRQLIKKSRFDYCILCAVETCYRIHLACWSTRVVHQGQIHHSTEKLRPSKIDKKVASIAYCDHGIGVSDDLTTSLLLYKPRKFQFHRLDSAIHWLRVQNTCGS